MRNRRTRTANRDTTINAAVRDGKIVAASADQYRRMWDANPAAIHTLLTAPVEQGGLMPGLVGSGGDAAVAAAQPDGYDESWLTPRERQANAQRRTAPAPQTPAAQAPAHAAAAGGEGSDEYPGEWLSGKERHRIKAAKDGTLTHPQVEFEDEAAKRAAGAS